MNPILKLLFLFVMPFPFGVDMAARSIVQRKGNGVSWIGDGKLLVLRHSGEIVEIWAGKENAPVRHNINQVYEPGLWNLRLWWAL